MVKFTRRDANHAQVVADLRASGYKVTDTADVGNGFPDAVVSRNGVMRLVEIKNPATRPTKPRGASNAAKLARQAAFRDAHPGLVITATSAAEVDHQWPNNTSQ